MPEVKYKFYATLLDSFQYYLDSQDSDTALQDLIDKINRKPFSSEAAMKGSAFNKLVDHVIARRWNMFELDQKGNALIKYHEGDETMVFSFKYPLVKDMADRLVGAIPQVFISAPIQTKYGEVELYGYADEVLKNKVVDIKTTGRYEFPKFLTAWQSKVYPYCFRKNGIMVDTFEYLVTDFSSIYLEEYPYKEERDTLDLRNFCERLIYFIEKFKVDITDKKVFALI